jgi:hypothetical protein
MKSKEVGHRKGKDSGGFGASPEKDFLKKLANKPRTINTNKRMSRT